MKNLAKILLPLAGLALLASPALRADEPATPAPSDHREHRENMRDGSKQMAKELNLTADQQTRAEAIRKQTAEAMKALRNDASLSEDQKRTKGKELRKAGEDQFMALLTPEQQTKAKELRAKRGHHGPADKPAGGAPSAN